MLFPSENASDHDPRRLEIALEEGIIVSDISLEVIKALNHVFSVDLRNPEFAEFAFTLQQNDDFSDFMDGKPRKLTDYTALVRTGVEVQTNGRSIEVGIYEGLVSLDVLGRRDNDLETFPEALKIMLAVRDRLCKCGYECKDDSSVDERIIMYGARFTKNVVLSTPEIAAEEMRNVLKALDMKKKTGKKKQ